MWHVSWKSFSFKHLCIVNAKKTTHMGDTGISERLTLKFISEICGVCDGVA